MFDYSELTVTLTKPAFLASLSQISLGIFSGAGALLDPYERLGKGCTRVSEKCSRALAKPPVVLHAPTENNPDGFFTDTKDAQNGS